MNVVNLQMMVQLAQVCPINSGKFFHTACVCTHHVHTHACMHTHVYTIHTLICFTCLMTVAFGPSFAANCITSQLTVIDSRITGQFRRSLWEGVEGVHIEMFH